MSAASHHRQIRVGIGQDWYTSPDGGENWERTLREIPGSKTPIVKGRVDLTRLPPLDQLAFWDFVTVVPSGLGTAVGHSFTPESRGKDRHKRALVYRTEDGGRTWVEVLMLSWPAEEFEGLAISKENVCA